MKNILFFSFLLISSFGLAQKKTVKFGKIDKANFTWDKYALDSSAHAVVLYDFGDAKLTYDTGKEDFYIQYERHIRIKVIDKAGIDWANHVIPLWQTKAAKEKLIKFKAATYNLENGKIADASLDKKDLLEERVHDNQINMKVAMPQVKEGSIIELVYVVNSPFTWNLVDWQFQYSIPVKYSEFKVAYPEWFAYKKQFKGYDYGYLTVNEETEGNGGITYKNRRSSGGRLGSTSTTTSSINRFNYVEIRNRWVAEKMPALEEEAYTSSINNFMTRIDFELASVKIPGMTIQNLTNTWEQINDLLMESASFGKQLNAKNNFLANPVIRVTNGKATDKEKVTAIYDHLKRKVLWNKIYNKYTSQSLKDTYEKGKGNVADINLLLIAMLRKAEIPANPVILSTKSNGILNPYFPSSRQFNYVIAQVKVGEKWMLLDATDRDLPMKLLPPRCYNEKGRLITKDKTDWVELIPTASHSTATALDLQLDESNQWKGSIQSRNHGYAASRIREKIKTEQKEKQSKGEEEQSIAQMKNTAIDNLEDIDKVLLQKADITIDNVMDGGAFIYFNPMTIQQVKENPFKLEERKYPIDYSYPRGVVYTANFAMPKGYIVEEVPEDAMVSLPNKAGFFSYSIKQGGDAINITYQLKIKKAFFYAEEYPALKDFYNRLVDKHAAQIVLKKEEE